MARVRPWLASFVVFGTSMISSCGETTRIELRVSTNLPCVNVRGVSVTVGSRGQVEDKAPAFYSTSCNENTGRLGTFAIVPVDEYLDNLELKVVAAVTASKPDDCNVGNNYGGCVVARRSFTSLPSDTVYIQVPIIVECMGTPCGPELTCLSSGECISSIVPNPEACVRQNACGLDALPGEAGTGGTSGVGGSGGEAGAGEGGGGQGGAGQGGAGQGGAGEGGAGQGGAGQGGAGQGGAGQGGAGQGGAGQGGAGQGGAGQGGAGQGGAGQGGAGQGGAGQGGLGGLLRLREP
ncbi:MAG: hypothetical protein MUF34_24865 [Polyangiaceae bacterium]|nr:hypothetical protein [Polyangiaceae bacterium]